MTNTEYLIFLVKREIEEMNLGFQIGSVKQHDQLQEILTQLETTK